MGTTEQQLKRAEAAKQLAKVKFADLGYSGIGLTRKSGRYAVRILLPNDDKKLETLPKSIDGVPIVFHVVGKVRKQPLRAGKGSVPGRRPARRY